MKFKLTHNDNILSLVDATEIEIDQLNLTLRQRIPTWKWDPRVKKGWWDGYISYFKGDKFAPSGLWNAIMDMGEQFNMPVEIEGLENKFDRSVDIEDFKKWVINKMKNHELDPRDYQIETAHKILTYKSCLAELATSAGKSLIVYLVFAYLLEHNEGERILMIVPNVSLVVQASEDFYDYNSGNKDLKLNIQQIFAGQKLRANCNIVIGTYQSLVKKKKEYFDQFTVVAVDETHKAKSASIKNILEKCQSDRKFGVSGTIAKPGTLDRLTLMAYTGPVITQISADFLIKKGFITPCRVKVIEMSYASEDVKTGFKQLTKTEDDRKRLLNLEKTFVIQNQIRLNFLTDVLLKLKTNTLVLFHRLDYGDAIYNMLRQKSDREVFYIAGETDTDVREQYKAEMEDGVGKILVASYGTFSTGINVKNLHNVAFSESFKSDVIIRQSIGRGLRKHADKDELLIIDFVDDFCSGRFTNYLFRHAIKRQEIYTEQNFPYSITKIDLSKKYSS
jgi:superfamily II DNA or RNA helicase